MEQCDGNECTDDSQQGSRFQGNGQVQEDLPGRTSSCLGLDLEDLGDLRRIFTLHLPRFYHVGKR